MSKVAGKKQIAIRTAHMWVNTFFRVRASLPQMVENLP